MRKSIHYISLILICTLLLCTGTASATEAFYCYYHSNGATGGTAPDPVSQNGGLSVTVADQGDLVRTGYSFLGWNTAADGSGTCYSPGSTFTITSTMNFYAQWICYSGGSGTIDDPYQLSSASDIVNLSKAPDHMSKYPADWGMNFTLTNDITLVGNHTPIRSFKGNFNGSGYSIKNLTIYEESSYTAGFFGDTGPGANIHDLGIETSSEGVTSTGNKLTGILLGRNYGGTVTNCYVTGNISGGQCVGGLVGQNNVGTVTNSYFTGTVTSSYEGNFNNSNFVGGLVGLNDDTVSNSYATGTVTSSYDGDGESYVGGLVGLCHGSVRDSYATSTVTSTYTGYDSAYVGGLVGQNLGGCTVSNSYASGSVTSNLLAGNNDNAGGLVGTNYGTVTNSFATGTASGSFDIGGLVGNNTGGSVNAYCYYSSTSSSYNEYGTYTESGNFANFSFVSGDSGLYWNASGNIITTDYNTSFIWKMENGSTLPYFQYQYVQSYSGGSGTIDDPYLLSTDADIDELSTTPENWSCFFKLMDNIVLEGKHTPIGNITIPFTGNFSGDGHVISNLTIYQESNYAGFFGCTNTGANIHDLGIGTSLEGVYSTQGYVGGLVGTNWDGTITNCSVTGTVFGSGNYVGGLVGYTGGNVSNSFTVGNATGSGNIVGGLVGDNEGTVINCYANVNVTGSSTNVGGLVGYSGGNVSYCYATGTVSGSDHVGGLVGLYSEGSVSRSFAVGNATGSGAYVGGLVGRCNPGCTMPSCYYSGAPTNSHATSTLYYNFTRYEFVSGNSGLNWNENITTADDPSFIWKIIDGYTLPYFQWQDTPAPLAPYIETMSRGSGVNNTDSSTLFWINVTGYCFNNTTYPVMNLTKDGQNPITGNIANISHTTINATFDLTKAIAGDWSLYVINPDGQTSTAKTFRVDTLSAPRNLKNNTGNFYVNWTWDCVEDADFYNVSYNGTWANVTTNYYNHTYLPAHGWSNVTVYAYNATYSILSEGASGNVSLPNNDVRILNATGIASIEGASISFDINYSDADDDKVLFDCNQTSLFDEFNTSTGEGSWKPNFGENGTYYVEFNVSDGYGSVASEVMKIIVEPMPSPENLANSTGNFWVNHSWTIGTGAVIDSYNVSYNDTHWANGTTNYYNHTGLSAHNWSNVTVFAYNATYSVLSLGVSENVQIPDNDVVILNVTDIASIERANIIFDINYSDADNDNVLFGCNQTSLFDEFNTSTGEGSWKPNFGENGTYYVEFNVSDGYGPVASEVMKIIVELMPSPENLANSTGNFWVNHSWTIGSGAVIDSYNVSYNDTYWANGTTNYYNHTGLSAHGWSNITVYAYNATYSVLSEGASDNVSIPNNEISILDVTDIATIEGASIIFDINYTDVDDDKVLFGCNQTSLFDRFNNKTGEGFWKPNFGENGTYCVEFNVSDGHNSIASQVMNITVEPMPSPENFANSTGNFWVNHSWTIGTGAVIDSYNVSYNDTYWANSTTSYFNHTGLSAHAWSNVTVHAYNATYSVLSPGVSENVQIPNNEISILDVTNITTSEGKSISFDINFTDADDDTAIFGCNQSSLFDDFNTSTGEGSWDVGFSDSGTHYIEFNVSDEYGSVVSHVMKITVANTPTIHVGNGSGYDFSSIQDAVNDASEGTTILVADGTYNENIDVYKSVILRSENGAENTIVNATNSAEIYTTVKRLGHAFYVTADNVTIDGFNVTGATDILRPSSGEKDKYAVGIYLIDNSNCTISNNTLIGNCAGIALTNSNNNTLRSNIVNDNELVGIILGKTTDNVLTNNVAMNNTMYDIAILGFNDEINDLKITENGAVISFLSDKAPFAIKGNATNSTSLSGKVNVNGYFTIGRDDLGWDSVDIDLKEEIEPSIFIMPINITVSYDDSGMSSYVESSIDMYKYNGNANESTWIAVSNTSLNTSSNQITVAITEGTFGLFRNPEPSHSDDGVRASVSQGQDPAKVLNSFTSILRVTGGSPVEYDFSGSDTPVLGISFDAKKDKGLVVAKVQVLSSAPEGVPAPSGNAYQIMSIDVGSEGTISSDSADDVIIHFKVSKQWIEENNIDISTIRMTRYHGEQWNDLPTTQENEDDEYFYFYAETPGFSVFEIVGDEIGETPEQVPVASPTTEDEEPEEDAENSIPGFTALAGIVLVSLAVLVRRK